MTTTTTPDIDPAQLPTGTARDTSDGTREGTVDGAGGAGPHPRQRTDDIEGRVGRSLARRHPGGSPRGLSITRSRARAIT